MIWGRDSVVSRATRYGLHGPGVEPRLGQKIFFSAHPSRPSLWPIHPPVNGYLGSFPGEKRPGRDDDHQLHLAPTLRMSRAKPLILLRLHGVDRDNFTFLGAFTKFRKATIKFVTSVCPSVRPTARNNSASTGRIFMIFHDCFSKTR
jgi:hypothetical protein